MLPECGSVYTKSTGAALYASGHMVACVHKLPEETSDSQDMPIDAHITFETFLILSRHMVASIG